MIEVGLSVAKKLQEQSAPVDGDLIEFIKKTNLKDFVKKLEVEHGLEEEKAVNLLKVIETKKLSKFVTFV